MKVIDIIKQRHELNEAGPIADTAKALWKAITSKASRAIVGFNKNEVVFINNYANKYAFETAYQYMNYGKQVRVDTFEQWWAKQLANDQRLAGSAMARDRRVLEEISEQAAKRTDDAYREMEATALGQKADPVRTLKPGIRLPDAGTVKRTSKKLALAPFKWTASMIKNHWMASLGVVAGLLNAAYGYFVTYINNEEEIRLYIEAGMTPNDKEKNIKSSEADLIAWADKAHKQNNDIWHAQLGAVVVSLLAGAAGIKLITWIFGNVTSVGVTAASTVGAGGAAQATVSGIGKFLAGLTAVEQLYVLGKINNEADVGTIGNYIDAALTAKAQLPVAWASVDTMLQSQAKAAEDILSLGDKILGMIKPKQTSKEDEIRKKLADKQSPATAQPGSNADTATTANSPAETPAQPEVKPPVVNPYSNDKPADASPAKPAAGKAPELGYKTSTGWEVIGFTANTVIWGNEKQGSKGKHVELPVGQEP